MRVDGRQPNELRPMKITRNYLKDVEGAVLMEFGHTKVLCTATVQPDVPHFIRGKGQGWVTAEYGMLPRSSPVRIQREAGRNRTGRTQEIQRMIGRSIRAIIDMVKLGERTIILDCDVIQADGGTRTAAISGVYLALHDVCRHLMACGKIAEWPLSDYVAAISVGIVDENPVLDLNYAEDSRAEVDMNVVMTGSEKIIEIQGTAEKIPFSREQMNELMDLAGQGIKTIIQEQKNLGVKMS